MLFFLLLSAVYLFFSEVLKMFMTFVLLGFGHPNHRKAYFLRHVPLGLFSHADSCGSICPGYGYMSLGFLLPQNTGGFPWNGSLHPICHWVSLSLFLGFTIQGNNYLPQHLLYRIWSCLISTTIHILVVKIKQLSCIYFSVGFCVLFSVIPNVPLPLIPTHILYWYVSKFLSVISAV